MHMLSRTVSRAGFHTARALRSEYPHSSSGRPLTSYFRFMKDIRNDIVQLNPEASTTEIAKLVGQKWKELDDAARSKYKDEYTEAMRLFKEKFTEKSD